MFEVQVNNQPFTRFETGSLTRSIDNSSSIFSLSTSGLTGENYPIKRGDQITIIVSGEPKIFGFVDQIQAQGDSTSHTIQISGRDSTCDLIDSTVPDSAKTIEGPITLQALCEAVISGLGADITVINSSGQSNEFTEEDLQAAESGDRCMEYLQSYSRKKQVFLLPSGDGSLVIFRPGANNATSPLLHQIGSDSNNVKSWSVVQSQQNMYNKYVCRSQDNIGFNPAADYSSDGVSRNGLSTDSSIRTSRFLEFTAEESMNDSECLERSKEEANVRRARSIEYTAVVSGFTQIDGSVWDIGQRVTVKDEVASISGIFIIRAVEYTVSISDGEQTKITCAPIDAYSVQAVSTDSDSRKSDEGSKFKREIPQQQPRFHR